MEASERIGEILKYLKVNAKEFSEKLGYERPQLIYDIQSGKTQNLSSKLVNKIISAFPEFEKSWLLTGEGEMLKGQTAIGDHNTQVAGNSNSVNCSGPLDKALDEIAAQRRLVAKSQEQIDRLLGIVEKLSTPGPKQG